MNIPKGITQINPTTFKVGNDIVDMARVDNITSMGETDEGVYCFSLLYYPGPYGSQRIRGNSLEKLAEVRRFLCYIKEKLDIAVCKRLIAFLDHRATPKGVHWIPPDNEIIDYLSDHK